jgi:hypothetical protein
MYLPRATTWDCPYGEFLIAHHPEQATQTLLGFYFLIQRYFS